MNPSGRPQIPCGMYAFTVDLRNAWTLLLRDLPARLGDAQSGSHPTVELLFDTSDDVYESPDLLIGHTCGYPYITRWRETHEPVATPVFDLPGCRGHEYSSWFVCRRDDRRSELIQFAGTTVAVNHLDSNSGMNVLRDSIKDIAGGQPFFGEVRVSGSHLSSMNMITRGEADIAAIDAVTYHHATASAPILNQGIRIIGQSVFTPGLPFIAHPEPGLSAKKITQALNASLKTLNGKIGQTLGLAGFHQVDDSDYELLAKMASNAAKAGYPELA